MYLVVWTATIRVGYSGNLTVPSGAKLFDKPESVKRFSKEKWAEGFETTWFKWVSGGITKELTNEEFKAIDDITV